MTVKEFYSAVGGDYEGTLARFLDEDRMRRFALKFENDPSFSELCKAIEDGNVEESFRAAHTLKGVCQNLGFTELYKYASDITEIFRAGSMEVGEHLEELKKAYGFVLSAIRILKESY